jgi:hypothetical protein
MDNELDPVALRSDLETALAADSNEKNYHIRQALQRLGHVTETDSDC